MSRRYTPPPEPPRWHARSGHTNLDPWAGRGCRNKQGWPKRKQALGALNNLVAHTGEPSEVLNVYKCAGCRKWHVGHRPGAVAA